MLARRIVDRGETRFDALQLCWIDLETPAIVAERARRLLQLNRCGLDKGNDLA